MISRALVTRDLKRRHRRRNAGQPAREILKDESGSTIEPELAPLRKGELERSCADPSRAEREIVFKAEVGFDEGLR
jgi:hypothetical protein